MSFFTKLVTGAKNLGSSTNELEVKNARNQLDYGMNQQFQISEEAKLKCKIILECESLNRLIEQLKKVITGANEAYDKARKETIADIKREISVAEEKGGDYVLKYFFTLSKAAEEKYNRAVSIKEKAINTPVTTEITGLKVFVEGIAEPSDGKIISFNCGSKVATIKFTNKSDKEETLYDYPIAKLCVKCEKGDIQLGGSSKYYKFVKA